jgi:hypothetical protein
MSEMMNKMPSMPKFIYFVNVINDVVKKLGQLITTVQAPSAIQHSSEVPTLRNPIENSFEM